jgi:hypothetical protein
MNIPHEADAPWRFIYLIYRPNGRWQIYAVYPTLHTGQLCKVIAPVPDLGAIFLAVRCQCAWELPKGWPITPRQLLGI